MTEMLKGIAASDGVAVAKAYLLVQPDLSFETVTVEDTSAEEARLDAALEASQNELSLIRENAVASLGEEAAQVFDAHMMVLADPEMIGQIKETIRTKKINAEAGLKEAMDRRGMKYDINEGDGAFYGPKIDFKVKDAIGRTWQCATIQLDFNLPERFDIKYQDKDGSMKTPVMLHRVIFGSMERFHGILIEHYAGAFPTWLAPTQVAIVPISNEKHIDFAEQVYKKMRAAGIRVNLDDRSESMNYKIRESLQDKKIPYVCVIGDKEIEANSVAVRARGIGQVGTMSVDEFISKVENEINSRSSDSFAKAQV